MVSIIDNTNSTVNDSFVGRFFEMKERNTNFTTELRGATYVSFPSYLLQITQSQKYSRSGETHLFVVGVNTGAF